MKIAFEYLSVASVDGQLSQQICVILLLLIAYCVGSNVYHLRIFLSSTLDGRLKS